MPGKLVRVFLELLFFLEPLHDELGYLFSGKQHTAENRPHAVVAEGGIGRHARHLHAGKDLARVLQGRGSATSAHMDFSPSTLPVWVKKLCLNLALDDLDNLGGVAGGINDVLRRHAERVNVQVGHLHRRPVEHHAGHPVVPHHHVLNAHQVENRAPARMACEQRVETVSIESAV